MTNIQKIAAYIDSSPNKERLMAAMPVLLEMWFSMNKAKIQKMSTRRMNKHESVE